MNIYLLRHGEAVQPMRWRGSDNARPLSDDGKKEIQNVAKGMAAARIRPAKILSSPYLRARQTAEIVAKELGMVPTVVNQFASGAKSEDFRKVVGPMPDDSVLVVGHIPDLLGFACRLIYDAFIMESGMTTGEMIAVETDSIDQGWTNNGKVLWRKEPDSW